MASINSPDTGFLAHFTTQMEESLEKILDRNLLGVIEKSVQQAVRPKQASISQVAWLYGTSSSTVKRHLAKYDIPKRDVHGNIHDGENHPIFINLDEWENKGKISTQVIKKSLA